MEKIKSPIVYMGNKFRLIDTILDCIPRKINHFYDLFGGSGTVSLNATAISEMVHYNELNHNIYGMFNLIINKEKIWEHIEARIKEFNLKKLNKCEETNKILAQQYKNKYDIFRKYVNENSKINYKDIFTLMHFSFNGLIRFSQHNKYNSPFCYTIRADSALKKWIDKSQMISDNVITTNKSFEEVIDYDKIRQHDFIYVDPPYMNTTAVYNENKLIGWNMKHELALFQMLEKLDSKGVKWAMSNIFSNSQITNQHLIDWCEKNGWYVKHLNIKYTIFGQKDKVNDEVLITNYDTKQYNRRISFELF